jgi:hypothetical protein
MTDRSSPEQRAQAIARCRAGESPSIVARSLNITAGTLRRWRAAEYARERSPAPSAPPAAEDQTAPAVAALPEPAVDVTPPAAAPPIPAPVEPVAPPNPGAFADALAAAAGPAPSPPATGDAPENGAPKLKPEQLVAMVEGLQVTTLRLVNSFGRASIPDEILMRVAKLTPDERQMHAGFAPYVVDQLPPALQSNPKLVLYVWFGVLAVSGWGRMRALRAIGLELARRRAEPPAPPARGAPLDPPPQPPAAPARSAA